MAKSTKRRPAPEKPVKTRKCVFCSKKGKNMDIDYKDTALLRNPPGRLPCCVRVEYLTNQMATRQNCRFMSSNGRLNRLL